MPVIGFNFNSIEAKREKSAAGNIKVNSIPKINSIKEITVPNMKKKVLNMSFDFTTKYDPAIAEIKISGELLYLTDNNTAMLSEWKKKKKLPEKNSIEILNHLFRRCLLKIANIADDLQLPPPLQLPRIKAASEEAGYIG